jgi:hypothetical protein
MSRFAKELAAGGKAAIDASSDPMIVVARMIDAKAAKFVSVTRVK